MVFYITSVCEIIKTFQTRLSINSKSDVSWGHLAKVEKLELACSLRRRAASHVRRNREPHCRYSKSYADNTGSSSPSPREQRALRSIPKGAPHEPLSLQLATNLF